MMQIRKNSRKHIQKKEQSSSPVMKKLFEHDKIFIKIDKRFKEIDKRFKEIDKRFEEIDKRFERIEGRLDRLTEKILEHDVRLIRIEENMVTKDEFRDLYNKIDSFLALYTKHDQEITIMGHRIQRTKERLDGHDQDISQIKLAVNLT